MYDTLIELLKYLAPVAGIIVGALLQFFLSKKSDSRKEQNLLKTSAYSDYLKAVAGIAISQSLGDKNKMFESRILLAEAKAKIAIYGSNAVIKKMAQFERKGSILNNTTSQKAFMLIALEMRIDNQENDIHLNEISQLLIGLDIEEAAAY